MLLEGTTTRLSTFSIVAVDLNAREWGVAVQSKFLAVGAVVPWAQAEAGAIATQAWANVAYGPEGLKLLAAGRPAAEVVDFLTRGDDGREDRQLGVVDGKGEAAAFTGARCFPWAGHVVGEGFSCQGNILVGPETVHAMAEAYLSTRGNLAGRLVDALAAGQQAGGDRRGQQSAGLLVVRDKGSYGGYIDRYIDLRVDDHPRPIEELRRLVKLFHLCFSKGDPRNLLRLEGGRMAEVAEHLRALGHFGGETPAQWGGELAGALRTFFLIENFEERLRDDDLIDGEILAYMREKATSQACGG
ncbi:MAG TPA: fimbrial assembly protein FimA [Clostridiales bacterium]|nr:fimbrial assembly protein FimA [Clostridiales bacterium]